MIFITPFGEMVDFSGVVGFVGVGNESCDRRIICVLQNEAIFMLGQVVIGVHVVADGRENTALGSACADGQGARCDVSHGDELLTICHEIDD